MPTMDTRRTGPTKRTRPNRRICWTWWRFIGTTMRSFVGLDRARSFETSRNRPTCCCQGGASKTFTSGRSVLFGTNGIACTTHKRTGIPSPCYICDTTLSGNSRPYRNATTRSCASGICPLNNLHAATVRRDHLIATLSPPNQRWGSVVSLRLADPSSK